MTEYEKALEIAKNAHQGQKRRDGEGYINHPIRVSEAAGKINTIAKIAAILHDVIEDSAYTLDDLRKEGISEEVVAVVDLLTHTENLTYLEYILKIKTNLNAKVVKMQDLKDNMKDNKGNQRDKYELAYYVLSGMIYKE